MRNGITLLLNVAVLLTNFAVCLGTTETQVRVARAAVRAVSAEPLRPPPAPEPPAEPRVSNVRLLKYLTRLEELDQLTPAQVEALTLAYEYCWNEFASGGERLLGTHDGARTRVLLGDLRDRVSRNVTATLKAAKVPDGALLQRLVRIVMASAG